ncbi:hypothetical protein C8A05DRAFT_12647 [Staphylotrichum tortipilum]|uniref:Uncharacterized protein n=1 Tax=Staphylotrichum tortipilum TaxID=2831512 RepID=A0AAN6MS80_9PEZI|nr:hypothetical protein C8A05DRAFT_12647 [Staphylotrichum longicolle]
MLSDTFSSLLSSFASCCGSRQKRRSTESSLGFASDGQTVAMNRNIVVLRDQPPVIPRPSAEPLWSSERTYEKTMERERQRSRERSRLRRTTSRGSSVRKMWFSRSSSSVRRLKISGPTDFRHLQSESFQLYPAATRPRPRSFRPIELSIYRPQNRLSPILPYIEFGITPPRRAHTANSSQWDASSSSTLAHERSYSTMSFHIPRKHARQGSGFSDASLSPPRIPPKSRARASRALTAHRIVERIASAIIEKERLQAEIDSVMERQSIYVDSRPSTAYDMRGMLLPHQSLTSLSLTLPGLEPMPSIPALPAAAPSFAERLSVDDHTRTASASPSSPSHMSVQEKTLSLAAAAAAHSRPHTPPSATSPTADSFDRPLAPPLPLVLRPPLRKKKSFSRVSSWLFHPDEQQHQHHFPTNSMASPSSPVPLATTNTPRPIKESDGFYQCVAPPEGLPRTSMETSSSVYTWGTGEGDDDEEDGESKTVPTTAAWSPEQTPKMGSRHTSPVVGAGKEGFEKEVGVTGGVGLYRPVSVGVAF